MALVISPLKNIPLVRPGDDLIHLLQAAITAAGIEWQDGDILVIAQKIISKAEDRYVCLSDVQAGERAREIGVETGKDPRLIELILRESSEVLRLRPGLIVVQHRLGFICANAGIDRSNVEQVDENCDTVLLLPQDPDKSAKRIVDAFAELQAVKIGVLIIDSHGRAWREGTTGLTIGLYGVPGVVDMRGREDLFGYTMMATQVCAADELAAAASLMMGQTDEMIPAVHVRGFPYDLRPSSLSELIRPKERDMFR